jgi:arabinose-5-phosphate isomerase
MILETARKVLRSESDAIAGLIDRIGTDFVRAIDMMESCKGRIVLTGMGKSGIICRKIAATLSSTGVPSFFLHPAEAIHGDLGMVVPGDMVIAISNSGETNELLPLLEWLKRLNIPLIALTGNARSTVARYSDVVLDVGVEKEACPLNLVPTASTTAAMAMGDALALCLMEKRGFREEDFASLHPGGGLGKRLLRVADLMRTNERIPLVSTNTAMKDVIYEMSRKGVGITAVLDTNEQLAGVISDGDLRRLLEKDDSLMTRTAGECMTLGPKTIDAEELATKALQIMEEKKITSLFIVDSTGKVKGVIHLHDLWRTEMI